MPKFPMDLSRFRKTAETDKKTTMTHDDGHVIFISHNHLKPDMKKALAALPLYKGGKVTKQANPKLEESKKLPMADGGEVAEPDPQKAKEMQAGATQSGWQPKQWAQNIKEGLGMAKGGNVQQSKTQPIPPDSTLHAQTEIETPDIIQSKTQPSPPDTGLHAMADGGKVDEETPPNPEDVEVITNPPSFTPPHAEVEGQKITGQTPEENLPGALPEPDEAPPSPEPEATPETAPAGQTMTFDKGSTDAAYDPTQQLAPRSVSQQMHAEDDALAQDMATGQIHPHTYADLFHDQSTLGKIGTIFGLLVGGMGSGLAHQPNALLGMMDKTLDRDLEGQKQSAANRQNFYKIRQQQQLTDAAARLQAAQATEKELANKSTAWGLKQAGILPSGVTTTPNGKLALTPAGQLQASTQAKMDLYTAAAHDLEQKIAKMSPTHPLYAASVGALNDLRNTMALEKQHMTAQVDKAHEAEEMQTDPVAKITGITRDKVPMPEVPSILSDDANARYKGLSAAGATSPAIGAATSGLKEQYQAASQADQALKTLVPTYQNLARLRSWSGRLANTAAGAVEGLAGLAGTVIGAQKGNPIGGGAIGEGVGTSLGTGLRSMAGTQQNRLYQLEVSKLTGIILNALKSTNVSHDQAEHWAQMYAPIAGDDDQAVHFKLGELVEKIKTSIPQNLLRDNGMAR